MQAEQNKNISAFSALKEYANVTRNRTKALSLGTVCSCFKGKKRGVGWLDFIKGKKGEMKDIGEKLEK
jgi:hypothetical protein